MGPLQRGIIAEHWGNKVFWVVQEPIYQNLVDRYSLHGLSYPPEHNTVFAVYDLDRSSGQFRMELSRWISASVDGLLDALRNPVIPAKDKFVGKLQRKINAKIKLKVDFE